MSDGAGAPAILALAGPGARAGTKLSKGVLVFVPDVEFAPDVEFDGVVAFDGGASVVLPGRGEESATLVFVASGANSGDACTPHATHRVVHLGQYG